MARNWPGPFSVEFSLTTTIGSIAVQHSHEVNCYVVGDPVPGTLVDDLSVVTRSGSSAGLIFSVQNYWMFYRQMLSSATVCDSYTVWRYLPNSEDKTFIATSDVDNPTGNGGAATPAHQIKMTFRTALGNIMQLMVMESHFGGDYLQPLIASGSGSAPQQLAAYVLSSSGWLVARDDAFPVAALRIGAGQNEVLYRKRFR